MLVLENPASLGRSPMRPRSATQDCKTQYYTATPQAHLGEAPGACRSANSADAPLNAGQDGGPVHLDET